MYPRVSKMLGYSFMSFELKKTKSLQIAEMLESEIRHGQLAPGVRIQSVRLLSDKLNVSMKVIQDAFELLASKGLIECRHGCGTFVRKIDEESTKKIAFLFKPGRSIEESYHFQVFQHVCYVLKKAGFAVNLATEIGIEELQTEYAGVVISSTVDNRMIANITESGIPCVVYGKVTGLKGICEVYPDYFGGSNTAVNYLAAAGYVQIYFILAENEDNLRGEICLQGYLQGLKDNGIAFNKELICKFSCVDELLQTIKHDTSGRRQAIYIPNDATAYDINNRLRLLGVRVPDHVALMGFYNRNHSSFSHPPLTTVGFEHEAMGKITAAKLLEVLNGRHAESAKIPVEIIERESVEIPDKMTASICCAK